MARPSAPGKESRAASRRPQGTRSAATATPKPAWLSVALAVALLALFFGHTLLSARHKTPTVDEFAHLPAGYFGLTTGDFSLYGKTPPLARSLFSLPLLARAPQLPEPPPGNRMAGWYPWTYATGFFQLNLRHHGIGFIDRLYADARAVVVLLAVLLGSAILVWAWRLHGPAGGLLALALFTLEPTILAHSRLATVDLAASLFFFLAVAHMVAWLHAERRRHLIMMGLAAGAALATKFTAVLLLPVAMGLILVRLSLHQPGTRRRQAGRLLAGAAVALALALLLVNTAYLFGGTLRTLGSYSFRSQLLSAVQAPLTAWLPVPLPADLVRGFDAQQVDVEVGDFPNYLNGRWSQDGWWYYYPLAFLLKTPVPFTLLFLCALALLVVRRLERGRRRGRRRTPADTVRHLVRAGLPETDLLRRLSAWAVGLSAATLLFAACFLNRLDIGVRYILPLYPFLFLGVASLGRLLRRQEPVAAGLILAAVLSGGLSTLATYPHYLAYFNFLAGGPQRGWTILANSNNDWGQDLYYLRQELERRGAGSVRLAYFGHVEPSAYGLNYTVPLPGASGADALRPGHGRFPFAFAPGLYAISVNLLVGLPYQVMDHGRWVPAGDTLAEPQQIFAWLRQHPPATVVGGSIILYDIPGGGR